MNTRRQRAELCSNRRPSTISVHVPRPRGCYPLYQFDQSASIVPLPDRPIGPMAPRVSLEGGPAFDGPFRARIDCDFALIRPGRQHPGIGPEPASPCTAGTALAPRPRTAPSSRTAARGRCGTRPLYAMRFHSKQKARYSRQATADTLPACRSTARTTPAPCSLPGSSRTDTATRDSSLNPSAASKNTGRRKPPRASGISTAFALMMARFRARPYAHAEFADRADSRLRLPSRSACQRAPCV